MVLSSCFAFDTEDMHIVDNIYVFCLDGVDEGQSLDRKDEKSFYYEIVEPMVYAIWNNDSIVIVKHHPLTGEHRKVNKDSTDYYVVLIDKECDERGLYNDSVIGPLDSTMLKQSVKELGIEEKIKFRDVKL